MNTNTIIKKVAIVTGASSGMGLGITQALLAARLSCGCELAQHQQIERFETLIRPHSCGRGHRKNGFGHKSGRCRHQTL